MVTRKLLDGAGKTIALLLVVALLFSTLPVPAGGFSIGTEREVGEKLLYSVRSAFELLDDPDITQYLKALGRDVLDVAGIQYFDYHFFIIDDKEFNAFAAPSGLIFFYVGLLATMNSEDELVSVLAHEIGHIDKRHLASRVEKGTYTSIASLGLAVAAIAFGGAASPVLLTGALAAGQSINLHFSRQHEEEADLLAYEWLKKLGRDPAGQAKMLETMRRIARYRSEKLPQYLMTHPNPENRLRYIESLLEVDGKKDTTAAPDRGREDFSFLRFKYRILSMSKTRELASFKSYLASVLSSPQATEVQKIMAQYGLSQVAVRENNFARSLSLLDQVIAQFPDKTILLVDKAASLFDDGKLAEAEQILRTALATDNSLMYGANLLGKILYRTGRAKEAEKYFKTVSYELPEFAEVYFELGQIAADKDQQGMSRYYLGKFHLYEGKLKLAKESLKQAQKDGSLADDIMQETKDLLKKIEQIQK